MRTAEQRLRALESGGPAVLLSDGEGRVRFTSDTANKLFGRNGRKAIGSPCRQVARFRTACGSPFCSTDCPVRRQAREGRPEPTHRLVFIGASDGQIRLRLYSFIVPGAGVRRRLLDRGARKGPGRRSFRIAAPNCTGRIENSIRGEKKFEAGCGKPVGFSGGSPADRGCDA